MPKTHTMRQTTGLEAIIKSPEKFTFDPKEGIDNPVMVITDDADSALSPSPRLCVLKREEGETYGFHLRIEKGCQGHVVRNVTTLGVAERSGLRDGDRLLEVNNHFVDDVSHPEVARKIRLSGNQLSLLVLDGDDYDQALARGQDLRPLSSSHKAEGCKPPRLCHITRDPVSGLGINFTPVEGQKGRFSVSLVAGGPAEKAGVCKGDRLVWMNGAAVSDLTHSALSRMMKKCGDSVTVLVIDSKSEEFFIQQKMPILPAMAVPRNLPHVSRHLHLLRGADGYGFFLKLETTLSGRTAHVLREVDRDSPAERAGMRDGEVLLEVNRELVESLKHEDIVDRVIQSGQKVTFTTINSKGLDFYTQLGLSPLLFCEDDAVETGKESNVPAPKANQLPPKDMDGLPKPRLCSLQKGPWGFGFNLGCVLHSPGTFISQVAVGGAGEGAGLHVGDVVMEVNGQNVEEKYLEDVIVIVKDGGKCLSLLVMDKNGYDKTKQPRAPSTRGVTESEEEGSFEKSSL